MKNICVITGGGSGMGLEAAKLIGKEGQHIILVGRTASKLDGAVKELQVLGIEAESFAADASDRGSVQKLADYAASKGNVKTLIHAAGVSPHMAEAMKIFAINALGTINVNEEFASVMTAGSCILNVSSMSAYMLPAEKVPTQLYRLAFESTDKLLGGVQQMLSAVPEAQQAGMAYTVSKNFVIWYTARMANQHGKSGIRVVSISPGTFNTPMGKTEGAEAAAFAESGALGRMGEPEEIARMMAFMVSDACSYLTGVDILYDGGSVSALNQKMEDQAFAQS